MPTDPPLLATTESNQASTSTATCNDDIKVEAKNSNVNINRGNDNLINQYQDIRFPQILPEKITPFSKSLADTPTDSTVSSSNQSSKSSNNSNNDIKIEATKSIVANIQGNYNTVHQLQAKPPPSRIEYKIRNPVQSFTGRENILQALHTAIEKNRKNGNLTIITSVVTGLGGIGKTETVRKYIQQYKATYNHVLWINAEKNSQVTNCLISIATLTNIISAENIDGKRKTDEEIAAEVYNFICKKPSFIVFDNANSLLDEDGEDGIGMLLPRSLPAGSINPAIVVTSRNRNWDNCQVIPLSGFADEESYNLLREQLQFQDTQANRSWAAEITHLCDGLPLVIQQVIEVIKMESEERDIVNEEAYGMQDFLNDYHRGSKGYMDEKPNDVPVDLGASHTVYKVFNLTFLKLSKKIDGDSALEILNILSLLNPDGIPVDLLLSLLPDKIQPRIKKALILLRKYNLLNLSGETYTIHRMIQKVRIEMLRCLDTNLLRESIINTSIKFCRHLDKMASNNIQKFLILENGIRLVNIVFKEQCGKNSESFLNTLGGKFVNYGKYYNAIYIYKTMIESGVCERTEVQIEYQEKLARTYKLEGKYIESYQIYVNLLACDISKIPEEECKSEDKLRLIYGLAELYFCQGIYGQAQTLLQYVITNQTQFMGTEHQETLATQDTLADVFLRQRNYTEAEELYTGVLNSRVVILGPEHPDTLLTKNNLALVFKSQGKYTEAETLFTEVLKSQMVILGPEHPSTLTTKHNLALVFYSQGKYTEAEELYSEVLKSRMVILGLEHPSTLTTKHNLASVFYRQGKFTEAEELYSEVLKSQMVLLGPEHPDTLTTKHNLASVFYKQGKYTEAEELYNEVLKSEMVILGPDHPNTLTTKHELALVFKSQGKYTDAEELYTDVLKSQMVILGQEHPDTLTTKHNLALVFYSQGKYTEAEELYSEVLKSDIVILGPEHPDTLATKHNLASAFDSQGKYTEAEELYTEVLKSKMVILGPEHPSTLATKNNLALVFDSQGKCAEAEELYTKVLKSKMVILGPEHPDTLTTKHNLASVFYRQGKFTEAEELYSEVLKSRMVILGPEHPNTLITKNNLALVFDSQGKYRC